MAKYSISCGGTGGHVFPGMATGLALQKRGHHVALWLSGKAIESVTRQSWPGQIIQIDSAKLSFHPFRLPRTLLTVSRAYCASLKALRQQRPQALLAMGSYSSLGPVLAARSLGIPVILHEANVIPGKAISFLARLASAVAITFPETRKHLKQNTAVLTGLPLRREMTEAAARCSGAPARFTVLTMGGSQGAQRLNEIVPVALSQLRQAGLDIAAIHLAGERDKAAVENAYRQAGVPATVHGFCFDMATVYGQSSLAISRSGANSCLELALFGIPAILVPLPTSARDHQKANAAAMMDAGAAIMLEQTALSPALLADSIRALAVDPLWLAGIRDKARARFSAGADEALADLIEKIGASR